MIKETVYSNLEKIIYTFDEVDIKRALIKYAEIKSTEKTESFDMDIYDDPEGKIFIKIIVKFRETVTGISS